MAVTVRVIVGDPKSAQKVIGAKQACDLGTLAELRAQGVTHLALNAKTYGRYFKDGLIVKDAGAVGAKRAFYETALQQGRVLHEWKLGRVRHFQPGLALVDITELDVTDARRPAAGAVAASRR